MITSEDLQGMLIRGDQVYFGLFAFALLCVWFLFLASRSGRLRSVAGKIHIPLPEIHLPAIVLIAFVVRIPLMFDSLWYDEAFTAQIASVPFNKLPAAILGDVHPPLWYTLEWVWTRVVGTSEFALRFPSLVFGLLFIYLAYRLGKALLLPQSVRLTACLILALLPAPAYYAAEARGYALLACLAFGMLIAVCERRWILFLCCGVLICFTHNLGYAYLGILGLYAAWRWSAPVTSRPGWRRWLKWEFRQLRLWLIIPALLASIWLPFMLQQSKAISDGFWIEPFSPGMGLKLITDETVGRKLPDALVLPVYLVILVVTVLSLWQFRKALPGLNRRGVVLALAIGVPASVGVLSLLWHPVYLTRALLPCGCALAFLWAYGLHQPGKLQGLLRLMLMPAILISVLCSYIPSLGREDVRTLLGFCKGVDYAYGTSIPAAVFLRYYVDAPLINWPESGDLNQTLTPASKAAIGLISGDFNSLHGSVCIAALDTPNTTPNERAEVQRILDRYPYADLKVQSSPIYDVTIYRVTITEGGAVYASR